MLTKQEMLVVCRIRQLLSAVETDANTERQKESRDILERCGKIFEKNIALNAEKMMVSHAFVHLKNEHYWDEQTYWAVSNVRCQWVSDIENEAKQCRAKLDQLCQAYKISKIAGSSEINTLTFSELFATASFAYAAEMEAEVGRYLTEECEEAFQEIDLEK